MNRVLAMAGRMGLVVCVVTTAALAVFVCALAYSGSLERGRLDAAVRALRGEPTAPAPAAVRSGPRHDGDLRELETLILLSEARSSDLRAQQERIRAERRAAEKDIADRKENAAGAPATDGAPSPAPVTDEAFRSNLAILRNHVPRTAATMIADWAPETIVAYLRAMKPYEAAEILGAMLAMGARGEVDYGRKAKDIQEALGQ